jgi:hypothetical protein
VLLVGALSATACGDDDDTSPVGGAGEGGEDVGGSGGSGGSAGSTAVGGGGAGAEAGATPGGAAGTGGSAGEAGASGASGASGAGGDGAAPFEVLDCEQQPVQMDPEWVRYCTVLSACTEEEQLLWCLTAPTSPWNFQFGSATLPLTAERPDFRFEVASCGSDIATCEDVLACAGSRLAGDDCEPDVVAHCDGERAVNCAASRTVDDCERLTGEQGACQLIGEGEEARAICVIAATCSQPGTESCDGDKVVKCLEGGVAEGRDCAEFGLECAVERGHAVCVPPAPTETCTNTGVARCDDGAITYCNPDGALFRGPQCTVGGAFECGSAGADNSDDRWWDCLPAGCDNSWNGEDARCEGDDYVFDAGFMSVRVHCPDYGFATCRGGRCAD